MILSKSKALKLIPNLTIAAGILAATYAGTIGPLGAWRTAVSAPTLASAILGADAVNSLLRFGVMAVSWATVLLSSGFLLAVWLCRESGEMSLLIPSVGAIAWVVLLDCTQRNSKPRRLP